MNAAFASYIETSIGNAVSVDAKAVYYNPAGLTFLKNKQIIAVDGIVDNRSVFRGTTVQNTTGYTQRGTTNARSYFSLPEFYLGIPINNKISIGLGGLYTNYGLTPYPADSIVRYFETTSFAATFDITPGIGVRLNDKVSIGGGLDFEYGRLVLDAMFGFPTIGVPDVKSMNEGSAWGWGAHVGLQAMPKLGTLIGLAYHTSVTFNIAGNSTYDSFPNFTTNKFRTKVVTPPSTVLSLYQFLSPTFGLMGTVEYMQWSTIQKLTLYNSALIVSGTPSLLTIPLQYHFRNIWRLALAANYNPTPKWFLGVGAFWDQEPGNPFYQLLNKDGFTLGCAAGYQFTKAFNLRLGYAHTFYRGNNINIITTNNNLNGKTDEGKDYAFGELRFDIV